jgi:hypothetical protein
MKWRASIIWKLEKNNSKPQKLGFEVRDTFPRNRKGCHGTVLYLPYWNLAIQSNTTTYRRLAIWLHSNSNSNLNSKATSWLEGKNGISILYSIYAPDLSQLGQHLLFQFLDPKCSKEIKRKNIFLPSYYSGPKPIAASGPHAHRAALTTGPTHQRATSLSLPRELSLSGDPVPRVGAVGSEPSWVGPSRVEPKPSWGAWRPHQ